MIHEEPVVCVHYEEHRDWVNMDLSVTCKPTPRKVPELIFGSQMKLHLTSEVGLSLIDSNTGKAKLKWISAYATKTYNKSAFGGFTGNVSVYFAL